jgi:hypothetical protein
MTSHTFENLSSFKEIDAPFYLLKIHADSCFSEYVIKADAILDEKMARHTKKMLEEAAPGRKHFLLVSSEGFFRVTKKARKLGADRNFSSHLAAVACYTSNSTLALLGELYNKINKPAVRTRVFYSREAAQEWLHEQMLTAQN